jgi:uncharacterized Zn finger protein
MLVVGFVTAATESLRTDAQTALMLVLDSLESLLTLDRLHHMAGDTTCARGAAYAREGRVRDLALTDGTLTAHVQGTETYQVRLWKHGSQVEFDCTCPVGDALRFCKHAVAAWIAWLAERGETLDEPAAPSDPREDPLERIRAFLDGKDEAALRELLLAEAGVDEGLRERLLLYRRPPRDAQAPPQATGDAGPL